MGGSAALTVTFNPGSARKYNVTSNNNTPVAGTQVAITAQLTDANGNAVSTSGKIVTWISTNGGSFSSSTSTTNASGAATVTFTTSTVAGTVHTVTGTDGGGLTGTSGNITTVAGAPASGNSTITGTSPVTADGTATSIITITLKDVNSNPVPGITPTFSASGSNNTFGPCSATNAFGISTCNLQSTTAEVKTLSIVTPVAVTGGTVTFQAGPAAKLALNGSTSNLVSSATRTLTATIQDANGNTVISGADSTLNVTFAQTASTGSVTGLGSVPAVAGVAFITVTGNLAGSVTITASATGSGGALAAGTGNPITFTLIAGTASALALSGSTTNLASGTTRTLTATIQDSNGNTVTSSSASVTFSQMAGTGSVTGLGSTAATNGVATRTVTGNVVGSVTITATATGLAAGAVNPITFNVVAGTLDHFKVEASGGGAIPAQIAGTPFNIRITAHDVNNNTVTSFTSTVSLTSNGTLTGSPLTSGAFTGGVLDPQSVTITSTGAAVTITATVSGKTGTSAPFAVDQPPSITSANSTTFAEGNGGTFQVTAIGFPIAIAFSESGTLPTGVSFNPSTGVLSGTPAAGTSAGSPYAITFTASNGVSPNAVQNFTLNVEVVPPPSTPALTCSDPDGVITSACGTPPTFTGTAQAGTTVKIFDGATQIGGGTAAQYASPGITTSNLSTPGTHSITATATDSLGYVSSPSGALVLTVPGAITPATIGTQTDDKSVTTLTQTASVSVGSNPSQMNTIIVTVAMDATTSNITVGDSAGNTYTNDIDVTNTGNIRTLVFSAPVTHALSSGTITVNFPSPTPTAKAVSFLSVNGLLSPSAEDQSNTATGNSNAPNSGNVTTVQADEFLIGALGVLSQGVSYNSFGQSFQAVASGFAQADGVLSIQPTFLAANATGTYAASGSDNKTAPWAAAVVTYKIKFPTVSITATNQDVNGITPGTITFTATFSQPVLGVDAADFALAVSGVSGASITSVNTADNTVYTVTVNTGSGNGTIQVKYHDDADITVDTNNIPLNGTVTPFVPLTIPGPVYTVNKSVATTTTVSASNNSPTYGTPVTFTAVVSPNTGTTTPTGTINFSIDGGGSVLGTNATCPSGSPANSFCATYSTSSLTVNGSPHSVTATYMPSGIFTGSSGSLSPNLTVGKADQATFTLTVPASITYSNTGTATATGGTGTGAVTFSSSSTGCSVDGTTGVISVLNTGQLCSISASKAGDINYNGPVTDGPRSVTLIRATVDPHITADNKVYDGTTAATILTRTLTGVIGTDDVSLTGGTATFADKNFGTGKTVTATGLSLTGTKAGNYQLSSTSATTTANITALHITGSFTASNKQYDGGVSAAVLTRSLSGMISGDAVSLTGGTATFNDKTVANGKTVTLTGASLSGTDAGNYVLDSVATTTANITALHITGSFTASSKPYDGNTSATVLTRSLSGTISGDTVSLTGGTATFNDKTVANGKTVTLTGASLTGGDAGNYVLDSVATATANITVRTLTVSATGVNKQYDGTTSATVTLSDNRVAGDVFTDSYTSASFTNKNVGTGKTVNVSGISISGTDAGNYTFNTTAITTANITPLHITGSFTASNKVYDGNTSASVLTETPNGIISPDVVTLAGGTAAFATKTAANGKTVTLTGATLSGTDAGNYVLDSVAATTANITVRTLTVSATGVNKVYDDTTIATVTLSDNRVAGDVFTGSYFSATFANKNVGNGKAVSVSGIAISGIDAGNYVLASTTATTTANITQAPTFTSVTVTPITQQYSDLVTFTATISPIMIGGASPALGVTFFVGTQNMGTVPLSISGGQLVGSMTTPLLEPTPFGTAPTGQMSPGSHTVTAQFNGVDPNFSVSNPTTSLTITQEDARVTYAGNIFVGIPLSSTSASITLIATIQDITAVTGDPAWDNYPGDIRNATVTFVNRDASNAPLCTASVLLVNSSDSKTGSVTCTFTGTVGSSGSTQYTVGIVVGGVTVPSGYYTRNASTDDTVVTISQVGAGMITGGGYLVMQNSAGTIAGDQGTKNNFGFNVKYNKSGTNLQGNVNSIVRRKGSDGVQHVYQIKGNSMSSLAVYQRTWNGTSWSSWTANCPLDPSPTSPCKAQFNGKANIQDITNPMAPFTVTGNNDLQFNMTDYGSPGSTDTLGITLWNASGGIWFSTNWMGNPPATVEQLLAGGNLVVH